MLVLKFFYLNILIITSYKIFFDNSIKNTNLTTNLQVNWNHIDTV